MIRVLAFSLLAFSTAAFAEDWPHFLGPEYNGSSTETGLLRAWPPEGPPKAWEVAKGAGHSAAIVANGRVLVFHSASGREILDCLDAADGKRVWRFDYDAPYTPQFGGGSGPCTNPTVAGNRVFTLGITGLLHCLDLGSGKVVWRRDLAREYRLLPTFFGQGSTPLALGDRLIVSLGTEDQKSVVALDMATGNEVWAAKHPWGSSYASPIPVALHGRQCVASFQGGMDDPPAGGLLVIDAENGEVLGATPHRAQMYASVSVSSPTVAGNRIFVGEAYTEGGACIEIAPDFSATVAWRAPKFDPYLGTPIAKDGYLYGCAGQHQQNAELVCYEIATGKEMWRDDLGGKFQRTSLLQVDGAFLALGENGDLAWLELTPEAAVVKQHAKLFHAPETWAAPVVSNGRLYIAQNQPGQSGTKPRLICYDFKAKR